ncbi:MAG: hypothetical protein EHM40_14155 [Chloroflexi bacterium]|nr:MAG: hypothetical protein EHM40_14155 [Chloroflexota bacterium]
MHSTIVKKTFLFLSLFLVVTLVACDVSVMVAPSTSPAPLSTNIMLQASVTPIQATVAPTQIPASVTPIPATAAPSPTPTTLQPSFEGVEVSSGPLSVVLPPGLTYGARGSQIARAEGPNVAAWDITPGHTQLKLEGYFLQGKSQQPQIYVYPAQAYAEMVPAAFESMHRLNNILFDPAAQISGEQLPRVPFFNNTQVFASNIQLISFQNGRGVRFLTEYAQYAASANNHDLFYHFQGVTGDGAYYVVAILPITAPMLAETSDGGAVLPDGGVPYSYFADPGADMQLYYRSVLDLLNASPSQIFTPNMDQLDALIQSIRIIP